MHLHHGRGGLTIELLCDSARPSCMQTGLILAYSFGEASLQLLTQLLVKAGNHPGNNLPALYGEVISVDSHVQACDYLVLSLQRCRTRVIALAN